MEAQIESGALASQNVGGPLSVTSMLAAICNTVKIPVQTHSNVTCDVENDKNLMFVNAMVTKRHIAIPLNMRKIDAPATLAPAARLAPTFQAANPSAVKLK